MKASDQSGIMVRHTATSRVSSGGEYYIIVSAEAACCSRERLSYRQVVRADGPNAEVPVGRATSGRKIGKLPPESPRQRRGWGSEGVNNVFTAT